MNRLIYVYTLLLVLFLAMTLGIITKNNTFEDVDYMAFYSAGQIVNCGDIEHLYDLKYQYQNIERIRSLNNIIPTGKTMVIFLNPPAYALLMSPVAKLPYLASLNIWRILCVLMFILCAFLLTKDLDLRLQWYHIALIGLASCPACFTFKLGQNSFISMGIYTAVYLLLKRNKDIPAGLLLSIGLLKPQLFWCLPIVLLMMKRWKAFGGFIIGSSVFLGVNYLYFGKSVILSYVQLLTSDMYREIWTPLQIGMHSLPSTISIISGVSPFLVAVAAALLVLYVIYKAVDQNQGFDSIYALTLIGTILASPHLFHYDVLMMFFPCLVMFKLGNFDKHIWALFVILWLSVIWPLPLFSVAVMTIMFFTIYTRHNINRSTTPE